MSEYSNTLAGLIQINDRNLADLNVTDLLQDAPAINALFSQVASNGTQHKYVKETGACGAAFREINTGTNNSASQDTLITVDLKLMDATFDRDKAIATGYVKGADAYMQRELYRALKASFAGVEKQLFNGTTGGDAGGFAGMNQTLSALSNAMVVNARGTAGGSVKTSVYLVRSTMDDVSAVIGNNGQITASDVYPIQAQDSDGGTYAALQVDVMGWLALQMGSIYSASRIVNITDESGKGLTDDLIAKAVAKAPAGKQFTHIMMNRTARMMLQQSRTATNITGAPAPFPMEAFGIPIVTTDGILNNESILSS